MTNWITAALDPESLRRGTNTVGRDLLATVDRNTRQPPDEAFGFVAETLELAAFQLLDGDRLELRQAAEMAFEYMRVDLTGGHVSPKEALKTACYGVLADRTPDVSRHLRSFDFTEPTISGANWTDDVLSIVTDVWLKLLRKNGWVDLDAVLAGVLRLRDHQTRYEAAFLSTAGVAARASAWQLIACYHLARAAEILAIFSTQGSSSGAFDVSAIFSAR